MKIKSTLLLVLAAAVLTGCVTDSVTKTKPNPDNGMAYISLQIHTPTRTTTRSSSEQPGATPEETEIYKLYAVTFDNSYNVIAYGSTDPAQVVELDGTPTKPKAFQVSSNAKWLLLIANPGAQLTNVLDTATEGMSFDALNAAITSTSTARVNEIAHIKAAGDGFTMINAGNKLVDSDKDASLNATLALVDISGKMHLVSEGQTAQQAKDKAEEDANRVDVNVERLAAKIYVAEKEGGATVTKGKFTFIEWVLDAVNSKFYPWAKKVDTKTKVGGTPGHYVNNFYTIDPNYTDNTGIEYNVITNYAPVVTWLKDKTATYVIENTMQAGAQIFEAATRVVIKSTYYPDPAWTGDWFSYAGKDYKDLAELKDAYAVEENKNLQAACDKFMVKVKGVKPAIPVDKFADLLPEHISDIENGGEVVKEEGCVRWYRGGLNYYWYEIRHDDGITDPNAFAKYGIVRNNWYNLTINSVSKAGTPWYPDINNPGPGDPDPKDPIDETEGYIGVTIEVLPWIQWSHNIDL